MTSKQVNTHPYPFTFEATQRATGQLENGRGAIPSLQASKLRALMLEAHNDPTKIVASVCSDDALSSRLCEEAGFPILFLAGYAMASSLGLPDTGYIAFQEVAAKIQETARVTSVPIIADGDTGYGSPMNVRRTVQGWSSWDHDSRPVMARTDSLIHGYEEALTRARKAIEIGVDAVFVEALPEREMMARLRKDLDFPVLANIIEGGKTENLSAKDLAGLGYSSVLYPWTLVAAKLRGVREALEGVKGSMMVGKPPVVLTYSEVCEGVGFNKYFELEERYQYEERSNGANGYQWKS